MGSATGIEKNISPYPEQLDGEQLFVSYRIEEGMKKSVTDGMLLWAFKVRYEHNALCNSAVRCQPRLRDPWPNQIVTSITYVDRKGRFNSFG